MLRQRLTLIREILLHMDAAEIDRLAETLPLGKTRVVAPPESGLIMTTVRDCFDTDFYLGEVLVTRCEVDYAGRRAQATIMGNQPKAALLAAILEAVCLNGEADVLESASVICSKTADRMAAEKSVQSKLAAATQVDFQSMAEGS